MKTPTKLTFFARFETDILAGTKTITIRDESEKNFVAGTIVDVSTFEEGREFCRLEILSVVPINVNALSDFHAQQENMTLSQLKEVIEDIYPGVQQLYVISYKLID